MDDYDREKADEIVLALMYLTLHDSHRAWKSFDWDTLDRLYEKRWIDTQEARRSRCCSPRKAWQDQLAYFSSILERQKKHQMSRSILA